MKRLLLLALPALLAGCPKPQAAADAPPAAAEPAEPAKPAVAVASKVEFGDPGVVRIAGTLPKYQWQLASAVDAKGQPIEALLVRPAQPVTLDFKGGQLAVGNTCNRMSGSYAPGGKGITVGKLASTMMACTDPKLMALDQEFGKRLQGKLGLRLSKGDARQLEMKTASGDVLVFTSQETAAPQAPPAEAPGKP
ncbi:MAG TPA: META domain-containing protein [Thermomonas sp.]|nr:META domain-containing protein [Thermomonas sp.]